MNVTLRSRCFNSPKLTVLRLLVAVYIIKNNVEILLLIRLSLTKVTGPAITNAIGNLSISILFTVELTYSHPDSKPKPRQVIKLHDKKCIDEYREQWYGWNTGHFKWKWGFVLGLTHKEHYERYQENP